MSTGVELRSGPGRWLRLRSPRPVTAAFAAPSRVQETGSGTRHALVRRFPYVIYFHAVADEIVVLVVIHGST
ncbi:MAG TPA: hypothetical protein VGT43_00705, partial [Burkholderiales bacterium]|nr:hypothetical protein [Burkholderiales bacterium]